MTIAQQWQEEGLKKGMVIAQQWKEEGMQQGVQQGMQQGMQQGEAAVLKRLLQRRFGEIPFICAQRIDQADVETLLYWSERTLDAKTLDEIFR
jgi:flagellar biosynthesis/type III secretory pathway protein FliH